MKYLYYNLTGRTVSVDEDLFELKSNKDDSGNDFENMKNQYIEQTDEGIYLYNILCIRSNRKNLENTEKNYIEKRIKLGYFNYFQENPIFILDNKKYDEKYKQITIVAISDIEDYLFKSRDFDSLIEYYYISFNNKLIMKNIKFKNKYKIIKNLNENFDNYLEGSYITNNKLCYIINSKIPKLSEEYIIIKVKDEEEIKEDLLYRNKIHINDEYIIIKNNKKSIINMKFGIRFNGTPKEFEDEIPLFVYNKKRLTKFFDNTVEKNIKYIDVNSEDEIREYLFNKDKIKIQDYYILKTKCICKSIFLTYDSHYYVNNSRIDMDIAGSSIGSQDTHSLILAHMQKHRKLRNCNL